MDFERKYKELLVEAWSYDTQALSIIKAIESSTIEEAEALIDELVEVLTKQANSYKKRMKVQYEDTDGVYSKMIDHNTAYPTVQLGLGMNGQVIPVIPINNGGQIL